MQVNRQVPYLSDSDLEALAGELLERYAWEIEPIATPPVPIEKIADFLLELNIEWLPIPDTDEAPILAYLNPDSRTIRLNEHRLGLFEQYPGVYEYTLAHEIGHYQLHLIDEALPDQRYLCRYKQAGQDRREWQAERFASWLLMPAHLMEPALAGVNLYRWSELYRLRDKFQVSITALRIRLEAMGRLYVTPDGQLYPNQALSTHDQRQALQRLLGQGQLYVATGQVQRAREAYHQALDIAQAGGFRREEASIAWNLGQLYADSQPALAVELMSICVAYEQELDQALAEADALVVEQLKARL